ncbi:hypothetical protein ACFYKX_10460 [Cytobacillus sp. FJAT-54145]|uniref:Uncharacterized protein n=1 Tax=Cytobacillus spartinae TaxID=3299023 RepID=A0ABW6K9Z2_9BACI
MKTIKLSELQQQIRKNQETHQEALTLHQQILEERGLKKGRVRPRDPEEQKILDSFTRK